MKRMLFALFPDRVAAERAREVLRDERLANLHGVRLHEGEIDVRLGVDLAGTRAEGAVERGVLNRFGTVFLASALIGLAIDLSGTFGNTGLSATMALGSLGIFAGAVAILAPSRDPLSAAITEANAALDAGSVLLTVRVDPTERDDAALAVSAFGGRTMLET